MCYTGRIILKVQPVYKRPKIIKFSSKKQRPRNRQKVSSSRFQETNTIQDHGIPTIYFIEQLKESNKNWNYEKREKTSHVGARSKRKIQGSHNLKKPNHSKSQKQEKTTDTPAPRDTKQYRAGQSKQINRRSRNCKTPGPRAGQKWGKVGDLGITKNKATEQVKNVFSTSDM